MGKPSKYVQEHLQTLVDGVKSAGLGEYFARVPEGFFDDPVARRATYETLPPRAQDLVLSIGLAVCFGVLQEETKDKSCVRCGSPYKPTGACSKNGCQGGVGEWAPMVRCKVCGARSIRVGKFHTCPNANCEGSDVDLLQGRAP